MCFTVAIQCINAPELNGPYDFCMTAQSSSFTCTTGFQDVFWLFRKSPSDDFTVLSENDLVLVERENHDVTMRTVNVTHREVTLLVSGYPDDVHIQVEYQCSYAGLTSCATLKRPGAFAFTFIIITFSQQMFND